MTHLGKLNLIVVLIALCGCGGDHPDVGSVRGKVTLDGQPLVKATVMFQPTGATTGRPSFGTTNDQGEYTLEYIDGLKGALIGSHKVSISTLIPGEDGQPPIQKEKLPARYHQQTELKADVKAGSNQHDFPLESAAKK